MTTKTVQTEVTMTQLPICKVLYCWRAINRVNHVVHMLLIVDTHSNCGYIFLRYQLNVLHWSLSLRATRSDILRGERDSERGRGRERVREGESERERGREGEGERVRGREGERERERGRGREGERENGRGGGGLRDV